MGAQSRRDSFKAYEATVIESLVSLQYRVAIRSGGATVNKEPIP